MKKFIFTFLVILGIFTTTVEASNPKKFHFPEVRMSSKKLERWEDFRTLLRSATSGSNKVKLKRSGERFIIKNKRTFVYNFGYTSNYAEGGQTTYVNFEKQDVSYDEFQISTISKKGIFETLKKKKDVRKFLKKADDFFQAVNHSEKIDVLRKGSSVKVEGDKSDNPAAESEALALPEISIQPKGYICADYQGKNKKPGPPELELNVTMTTPKGRQYIMTLYPKWPEEEPLDEN